jgi:DNA-directed RNA polymerase specialized sigma24 family protein
VVKLRFFVGLSNAEIADLLNLSSAPSGTPDVRQSLAFAAIRPLP